MSIVATLPDAFKTNPTSYKDFHPSPKPKVSKSGVMDNTASAAGPWEQHSGGHDDLRFEVRRPIRGLFVKPNTHAFIQVIKRSGDVVRVFNNLGASALQPGQRYPGGDDAGSSYASDYGFDVNSPLNDSWTDWLLQSVTEQRKEKIQLTETFGDPVLYVFGERPRFLKFVGYLINTKDFNWRAQFWHNWDRYFRATKLVEMDAEVHIGFDDIIVKGFPLDAVAQQSANNPHAINFSFTFYVTNYVNLYMNNVGSIQKQMLHYNAHDDVGNRARQYLVSGSFGDFADPEKQKELEGNLARIIGGDRLAFSEMMKTLFGWAGGLGDAANSGATQLELPGGLTFSLNDLILNPSLAYIKGSKSATEFLVTQARRVVSHFAYMGANKLADATPGGAPGLNFFFGLVGHLYRVIGINAATHGYSDEDPLAASTAGVGFDPLRTAKEGRGRWRHIIDNLAQVGTVHRLASYMGYMSDHAVGQIYKNTNKYNLANIEGGSFSDAPGWWTAKGQNHDVGVKIGNRMPFHSSRNSALLNATPTSQVSSALITGGQAAQTSSFGGGPRGEVNNVFSDDTTPGGELEEDSRSEQQAQELGAVETQRREEQQNHGSMEVLETDEELEDDGGD